MLDGFSKSTQQFSNQMAKLDNFTFRSTKLIYVGRKIEENLKSKIVFHKTFPCLLKTIPFDFN